MICRVRGFGLYHTFPLIAACWRTRKQRMYSVSAGTSPTSVARVSRCLKRCLSPVQCTLACNEHYMAFVECLRLSRGLRGSVRAPKHVAAGLPMQTQPLIDAITSSHPGGSVGFSATTAVFVVGMPVLLSGLTPQGVAFSWLLGGSIFSAFGAGGFSLVCAYFLLGSAATKFRLKEKEAKGIAEKRSGRRGPSSVIGSGLAGIFCAIAALATGEYSIFQVAFVASFCSKLSDTVSSEVGKGFGKTTYLVTTLQRVPPGTEGAVSAEGTMAGVAAALTYALLALVVGQVSLQGTAICTVAATIANILESYIGATSQDSVDWLTNDVVNVVQICIAAAIAGALQVWCLGSV